MWWFIIYIIIAIFVGVGIYVFYFGDDDYNDSQEKNFWIAIFWPLIIFVITIVFLVVFIIYAPIKCVYELFKYLKNK